MNNYRYILVGLLAPLVGCNSSSSSPDAMDDGSPVVPVISIDNAETLLREVVSIANENAFNEASQSLDPVFLTVDDLIRQTIGNGASSGHGLSFVSSTSTDVNGSVPEYSFSCDSGGTLVARAYGEAPGDASSVDRLIATGACSIDEAAYEGTAYKAVLFDRRTYSSTFENFSVSHADGDSLLLNGEYFDTGPEGRGPVTETGWTEASLLVIEDGETNRIDNFTSYRKSIERNQIPDTGGPSTVAQISFSVTAAWTSGVTLDVVVDLAYADAEGSINEAGSYVAQWQTGTLRVTAPDGSGLTLNPDTGIAETFLVAIDGVVGEPLVLNWADGFQVDCAPRFECS